VPEGLARIPLNVPELQFRDASELDTEANAKRIFKLIEPATRQARIVHTYATDKEAPAREYA